MSNLISAINVLAQESYKRFAIGFLDVCPQDIREKVETSLNKLVKRQRKLHLVVILLTFLTCLALYIFGMMATSAPSKELLLFIALIAVLVWTFWFALLFAIDNIRGRKDAYNLFYKYTKQNKVRIVLEIEQGNEEIIFSEIRKIIGIA